jgi:hypothetical protein
MNVPLLSTVTRWYCPACKHEDVTTEPRPHSRMHACPKFGLISVPMLQAGTKAKVEAYEREDYIGDENVQLNADGRPVMKVVTTRDEGEDCTVYAPTATARLS